MSPRVNRNQRSVRRLPRSLQAAWGAPSRSEKGPRPGLTLPQIVDAAIGVAASDGLEAVSMSRVASELGVATMSLYRYVAAKDELLALMVDAAFAAAPSPALPREGWRLALSRWAREYLAVLHRHPWVLRIPLSGPPILPNQMLWFERGLDCFRATALPERARLSVLMLVNGFVRNEALLALDLERAARAAGAAAEAMASYGSLLSDLIDAERFPAIAGLLAARVFEGTEPPDTEFEFGLARILDGIAAVVPRRRVARRA